MSNVFISYRREGGEAMAQLIHDRLVAKHVSVFYDIDGLNTSQPFDSMLFHKIEECNDVVLILPPRALDRCIYDNDWVRQEIRHALLLNKNIIPVMMRGFEFPSDLPDDIKDVARFNGVRMDSMEFFDAKIDKVISFMSKETREACEKQAASDTPAAKTPSASVNGNTRSSSESRFAISNVCTMGAVDRDEVWPKGVYTPIISLDDFNAVRFHVKLLRAVEETVTVTHGFNIYNASGTLVHEHKAQITFSPGCDMYSIGWIIRGTDGSYVKAGQYRADIWVENSSPFSIDFRVDSKLQSNFGASARPSGYQAPPAYTPKTTISVSDFNALQKKIYKVEGKLNTYKVLWSNFFAQLTFILFCICSGLGAMAFVSFVGYMIALLAFSLKNTKKYVVKNTLLALLLTTVGAFCYGIYLLIMSIYASMNKAELKAELAKLKNTEIVM